MKLDVGSVGSIAEITDVDISSRTAIVDVRDEVVVFLRLTSSQDVVVIRHSGHIVKIGRVGINIPIHQLIKNLEINLWWLKNFVQCLKKFVARLHNYLLCHGCLSTATPQKNFGWLSNFLPERRRRSLCFS